MKALTLHQPWASLVAEGWKKIETRSWPAPAGLGRFAIHAGKGVDTKMVERLGWGRTLAMDAKILPLGGLVAVVDLVDCIQTGHGKVRLSRNERRYGDYSPGRWAWRLKLVARIHPPILLRGRQRLWNLPAHVDTAVEQFLMTEAREPK